MIVDRLKKALLIGPATVISVAYIDPGNFGTNIEAGSKYGLALLWVVWLSGAMAILFQYLSGKMGIVAGKSPIDFLLENRRKGIFRKFYFLILLLIIFSTDMAEFVGIAVGLHLLLSIPLSISLWISIIDVLILYIFTENLGRMEIAIAAMVGIVGVSYIVELIVVKANIQEVLVHSFIPSITSKNDLLVAISIVGATVMPHAIILHAYLSKEKYMQQGKHLLKSIKEHTKETITNLFGASLINAALQIMSYYAFYKNGLKDIVSMDTAFYSLQPLYGNLSSLIFAIAILASGLSSSLVSVMAGVRIIELYYHKAISSWKVRLLIRLINMVPLAVFVYLGFNTVTILVYTQAVLSFTLPAVLIPLVFYSSKKEVMGNYATRTVIHLLSLLGVAFIIIMNLLLIFF